MKNNYSTQMYKKGMRTNKPLSPADEHFKGEFVPHGMPKAMRRQPYHHPASIDHGPNPFVVDIQKAVLHNETFRTALWTGSHLQLTLMAIPAGEEIGMEKHPDVDQYLCIVEGKGLAMMGEDKHHMPLKQPVYDGCAIFIPAGSWHNLINTGRGPLKLYSIYAPPNHPFGTVHPIKPAED